MTRDYAALRRQVVRVVGQVLRPVRRDEHEVLEADAAVARAVEARLDGDDVARAERRLGDQPEAGLLVHLEADAVPEPVEEAVRERHPVLLRPRRPLAGGLEDLAGAVEDVLAARA